MSSNGFGQIEQKLRDDFVTHIYLSCNFIKPHDKHFLIPPFASIRRASRGYDEVEWIPAFEGMTVGAVKLPDAIFCPLTQHHL